ncbi:MAG TPA: Fe-S cluster assembly protein SufB, partial [Limnochordia bacterium]
MARSELELDLHDYRYGFRDEIEYVYKSEKGLSRRVVEELSARKGEPEWMRRFRLKALDVFFKKPMPSRLNSTFFAQGRFDLSELNFDDIYYYVRPTEKQGRTWDEVPEEIKRTFDRLGIPEAERKFLAGVTAQYESEVVYHSIRKDLEAQGVIFCDTDTAVREHPDLVREYFGTVVPPADNKFAALNSAVWSGGSFIWVPEGVHVEIPLQAYFRINTEN